MRPAHGGTNRHGRWSLALLAAAQLAALLGLAAGAARAADPEEAAKARAEARLTALRGVVDAWLETRKGLVDPCSRCRGTGVLVRGRFDRVTCPSCKGTKLYIWPKRWQRLRYDVLSPAKRATLKVPEIEAERDKADPNSPDTGYLRYARFQRAELVGDRFGRSWAFEGRDTLVRETRWVEAVDPGTQKPAWFLFSEDVDGPWDETATPAKPAPAEPAKPETLKSDELAAVRAKVALCETRLSLEDAVREGGTLVLTLSLPKAGDEPALRREADASVVPLTAAALEVAKDATAVRLVVVARWRDTFGEVRKRPYRTAEITRDTWSKIHFDRLQREEALSHFGVASPTYDGEILWWKE